VDQGRIESKPIKGTVARGATPEEDQANANWLLSSAKDRAEKSYDCLIYCAMI